MILQVSTSTISNGVYDMEEKATSGLMKVRLVITSDSIIPKSISDFLGVSPVQTWLAGDPAHPRATNTHKENGWVLSLEGGKGALIVEAILISIWNEAAASQQTPSGGSGIRWQ